MFRVMDVELEEAERFLDWLAKRVGQEYEIKARPNPPDFVFLLGKAAWLEVSDIWLSNEQAKFESTPGPRRFGWSVPIDQTSTRLFEKLCEKLSKSSYEDAFKTYGPGTLLLTSRDFAFGVPEEGQIAAGLQSFTAQKDRGYFERAYFGYCSGGQTIYRVIYPRDEAIADWKGVL